MIPRDNSRNCHIKSKKATTEKVYDDDAAGKVLLPRLKKKDMPSDWAHMIRLLQKNKKNSPAGVRTRVSRVKADGDHHYTTGDLRVNPYGEVSPGISFQRSQRTVQLTGWG